MQTQKTTSVKDKRQLAMDEFSEEQYLAADHPLLAKMQATLTKQLEEELEQLRIEVLHKKKIMSKFEKDKEDVGIQLYESQQKLVELQRQGEEKTTLYNSYKEKRGTNEKSLAEADTLLKTKLKEAEELEEQLHKRMAELSAQNGVLKEIEGYNSELESEIKVKRRVTYKVEENIAGNERRKNRQDFLISSLYEEEKRISELKTGIEARLNAQKEQTQEAKVLLADGQKEIDGIMESKRVLLTQLLKTTMELDSQNNTLGMIKESLREENERLLQKSKEISTLEAEIRAEKAQRDVLAGIIGKLEKEEKQLIASKAKIEEKIRKIEAKSTVLRQAGESTEQELQVLEKSADLIKSQMRSIEENIMKFHSEIRVKDEELLKLISEHKTLEKLQKNTLKQVSELQIRRQEKEIEVETLDNEIARVRLDVLNTENDILALQEKRVQMLREQEEAEKTVSKYEGIIRANHDAHEKKMHEIAKFNREHDKARKTNELNMKGPSEVNLVQLEKEIVELRQQRKRLEGEFIKSQTLAVEKEMQAQSVTEKIANLRRKETILDQKKMRLNTDYNLHQKEIRTLQRNLKNYEKDMNRLNDFLAVFQEKAAALKNENLNLKSEFAEKLKALEQASAKLETEIDRLKEIKAETLQEIMERERQAMLWKRKTQLEKDMQETLDPDVGQQEIQTLKKDLHLMQLKLDEFKKGQDAMIMEIDRAVQKRDSIQVKYSQKESRENTEETLLNKKKLPKDHKSQVAKNIELLKSSINQSQSSVTTFEKNISKMNKENESINKQTDAVLTKVESHENDIQEATAFIREYKLRRLAKTLRVYVAQNKAKAMENVLKAGKSGKPTEGLKQSCANKRKNNEQLIEAVTAICEQEPELQYALNSLEEVRNVPI
jgi:hypothetical protein